MGHVKILQSGLAKLNHLKKVTTKSEQKTFEVYNLYICRAWGHVLKHV